VVCHTALWEVLRSTMRLYGAVLFSKLNSGGWPQAENVVESIGASAACGVVPQQ
jgi:hypothetical protein